MISAYIQESRASLKRQQRFEKQRIKAEMILEPQLGLHPSRRIRAVIDKLFLHATEKTASIQTKKVRVRTQEDPERILAWAVAQRIRAARERMGLRQVDLARQTGIARPNIVRIEQGRHMSSLVTLQRIAHILKISFSDLLAEPVATPADILESHSFAETGLDEWVNQLGNEDSISR